MEGDKRGSLPIFFSSATPAFKMDRPDPAPVAPSSAPGTSSLGPHNTIPGKAPTSSPAPTVPGTQGMQSPSESDPESRQASTSQQLTRESSTVQPPPQSTQTANIAPQQGLQQTIVPQQPPQPLISIQQAPETAITPGARPTTGSTLGSPAGDPQAPNPPTPPTTRPPLPQLRTARSTSAGLKTPSEEKLEDADTLSGLGLNELHRDSAVRTNQPLPALPPARLADNGASRRQRTLDSHGSVLGQGTMRRSGIDWIVPIEEKRKRTVGERIQPTLDIAMAERDKYAAKAKATGWALNAAIGLQVILGSLTTGLSAVATTGRQTAIQTTILGGLSTLVASYLARARGSNEPELSITRVKDLERFIRTVQAFQLDHGHVDTNEWDKDLDRFRHHFEELLGNADGERKLSPPV